MEDRLHRRSYELLLFGCKFVLQIPVLLLEDNEDDAGLVVEHLAALKQLQFRVHAAESIKEGVAKLRRRNDFQAIILDLGLPDGWGIKSLQAIKQVCGDIPIIVLTGTEDAELRKEAIAAGAANYLVKGKTNGEKLAITLMASLVNRARKNFRDNTQASA